MNNGTLCDTLWCLLWSTVNLIMSQYWTWWRTTSLSGCLFSAFLSRWKRDPGCGWSRDYLSIQNRRVGDYSSTFGREENPVAPPFQQIFVPPRFWVVTWPAATRVSVPTTKGGREERPLERGWMAFASEYKCLHTPKLIRDKRYNENDRINFSYMHNPTVKHVLTWSLPQQALVQITSSMP